MLRLGVLRFVIVVRNVMEKCCEALELVLHSVTCAMLCRVALSCAVLCCLYGVVAW